MTTTSQTLGADLAVGDRIVYQLPSLTGPIELTAEVIQKAGGLTVRIENPPVGTDHCRRIMPHDTFTKAATPSKLDPPTPAELLLMDGLFDADEFGQLF